MSLNFFRHEVVDHKASLHNGQPLFVSPPPFKLLACVVSLLLIALGCYLYWGAYTNEQVVVGYLLPSKGLITVNAPQRGTVVIRYAHLGEHVKQEQKLYEIVTERSTQGTSDVNAALIQQYATQIEGLHTRIHLARQSEAANLTKLRRQAHDLKGQIQGLTTEVGTERALLALAKKNVTRYRTLAHTGMVSQSDLQSVLSKALAQQSTSEQTEQQKAQLQAQLNQIPAEIAGEQSSTEDTIAVIKGQVAQMDEDKLQLQVTQQVIVRAPATGVVSSVMAQVGQDATPTTPLMSLLPQGSRLEARLLIPTQAIGFVRTGQPVLLSYSAFPYQQFGLYHARLTRVSRSVIAPGELSLPVSLQQPYYLATASLDQAYVRVYGRRMPLASGMTLSAAIVLNRERLYQWVLRPLESLRGHT